MVEIFSKHVFVVVQVVVFVLICIGQAASEQPNRNPRLAKRAGLKATCNLPHSWSGIWSNQQTLKELQYVISSITEAGQGQSAQGNRFKMAVDNNSNDRLIENAKQLYKTIDEYKFLNRGSCVNSNDERYFFYDDSGKCFRCLFIIQRHVNVLQYRETHCDEEVSDFDELCGMLTPDQPLITVVREDAIAEKCPFIDSYHAFDQRAPSTQTQTAGSVGPLIGSSSSINKNPFQKEAATKLGCFKQPDSNIITKCADHTMLRLDFQDCINLQQNKNSAAATGPFLKSETTSNHHHRHHHVVKKLKKSDKNDKSLSASASSFGQQQPVENGIIANCMAHWSEGVWHYLIVKQSKSAIQTKAKVSSKSVGGQDTTTTGYKCLVYKDMDKSANNGPSKSSTGNLIQLSMSDDEMCRDFHVSPDGQNSFTLEKFKMAHNRNSRFMGRKNSSNSNKVVEFNQNNYFPSPHNAHSQRWSHQLHHHGRHLHLRGGGGNQQQHSFCKFPKFLNKKWKNLQKTKYAISLRKNLLQIVALSSVAKKSAQDLVVNKSPASSSSSSSINNVDNNKEDEFKSETVFLKLSCVESIKPYSENTRLLRKNSAAAAIRKYSLNQPDKSGETSGDLPSTTTSTPHETTNSFSSELEFNAKEKLDYLFLVNNQLDCSSLLKCLLISPKSEFIIHIRYGNFDGKKCDFSKHNLIYEDYLHIETDQGINCPFSNRIYQLAVDKAALPRVNSESRSNMFQKRSPESPRASASSSSQSSTPSSLFSSIFDLFVTNDNKDCEHYLKIGCNNQFYNDYSVYKKCSLVKPPQSEKAAAATLNTFDDERSRQVGENERVKSLKKDFKYSMRSLVSDGGGGSGQLADETDPAGATAATASEPVNVEYESNRICLAFWRKNSKHDNNNNNNEYDQSTTIDDYELDGDSDSEYGYGEYGMGQDYHDDQTYSLNKKSAEEKPGGGGSGTSSDPDPIETSYVVLSKLPNSDKFSITCSIWESHRNSKKLRISYTDLSSCTNILNDDEEEHPATQASIESEHETTLKATENGARERQQLYRQTNPQANSLVILASSSDVDSRANKVMDTNSPEYLTADQQHYSAQSERLVVSSSSDSIIEKKPPPPPLSYETPRKTGQLDNSITFKFAGTCSSYKESNKGSPLAKNPGAWTTTLLASASLLLVLLAA